MTNGMSLEITDVACTGCGCVCDDLRLTIEQNRVTRLEPACPLAERWFAAHARDAAEGAFVRGASTTLEAAELEAARILRHARAPLIYGLSSSSTPGQRAAVRLAERVGATIDTSASTCHGPSILALQQVGESTCTLGEIRNRADLVVYWGSNPAESHPRHRDRYALEPRGQFIPGGRSDRTLVVVDTERTATAAAADMFVQVEPQADFEVIWALRGLLRGNQPAAATVGGVARGTLEELAKRLRSCRCGVFFFGRGLTRGDTGHAQVQALLLLTRDLNAWTRFHARRMRIYGDVAGADTVLCWQTGFPFSVDLSRGYPRYNPGEYSANERLSRGEIDACLLVGTDGLDTLSAAAREALAGMPTILLDRPGDIYPHPVSVRITTGVYGIHVAGTAYRMDEVPIPLRAFLPTALPTDAEVMQRIAARL
jgi:formylmethanofuran dehydrogenase subunit B